MKIPRVPVIIMNHGKAYRGTAMVIPEMEIQIRLNNKFVANIVCRPDNPEEPTTGLLHNHGIFPSLDVIKAIRVHPKEHMVSIQARTDHEALQRLMELNEREGCVSSRTAVPPPSHQPARRNASARKPPGEKVYQALSALAERFLEILEVKGIFGAYHVAALGNKKGKLLCQAGDLEMSVTVDRIFGKAFLGGLDLSDLFLLASGRLQPDAIGKAARHGIRFIITTSVITDLALEAARRLGVTLVLAKEDRTLTLFGDHRTAVLPAARESRA